MSRAAALLTLSLLACSTPQPKQDAPPDAAPAPTSASELERMQGMWTLVAYSADAPEQRGIAKIDDAVLTIMIQALQNQPIPTNIALDPAQQPATIDLTHEGYNPGPAPEPPLHIKGRYVWEDEQLTICVPLDIDGPRPATPLPCDTPDLMRMVFTRAQTIEGQLSE